MLNSVSNLVMFNIFMTSSLTPRESIAIVYLINVRNSSTEIIQEK